MGGVAAVSAAISEPGTIRQNGTIQRIVFGELDGKRTLRAERFRDQCQQAGFDAVLSDNVLTPIWQKFAFLTAASSFTAMTRLPMGKLREDPDILSAITALIREVAAVGKASGVALPPDLADMSMQMVMESPATALASMAVDLIRGNRLELPWLAGKVVELGRRHNVPTPVSNTAYAALRPYVNGTPA